MIELPNGNRCSLPKISPKNYKTSRSTKKDWVIQYRFYSEESPEGKQVRIKNFNIYKDYSKRKQQAEEDLAEITARLRQGYNPIKKEIILTPDREVEPSTPLSVALLKGAEKVVCGKHTKEVMIRAVKFMATVAHEINLDNLPICETKKRHIRQILERSAEKRNFTPGNYNHHRSYLMMAFEELSELEAIESNPVLAIRKRAEVKKIRQTLTTEERQRVNDHLYAKYYTFWRYLHIFFHSGGRTAELFRLQCRDVNLKAQYFKVTVRKGSLKFEAHKVIKDIVMPLWEEVMKGASPDDYIFSKSLRPGPAPINPDQISKRWLKHVKGVKDKKTGQLKGGIGITADFYALKHLHSDEISRLLSISDAQAHNSHASENTTRIYAVTEKERQAERLKKVSNKFA